MTIVAEATRSGEWWAVDVPELPGLFTQAKRLDQIPTMVEDAAALLGKNISASDVQVQAELSPEIRTLVERARSTRDASRKAEAEASATSRAAVARLRSEGLTVRDVAKLIGVSPQRVSALATSQH